MPAEGCCSNRCCFADAIHGYAIGRPCYLSDRAAFRKASELSFSPYRVQAACNEIDGRHNLTGFATLIEEIGLLRRLAKRRSDGGQRMLDGPVFGHDNLNTSKLVQVNHQRCLEIQRHCSIGLSRKNRQHLGVA